MRTGKKSWLGSILGFVVIAFFATNPETLELALFINSVGFDIYIMLLELQLLAIGGFVLRFGLKPIVDFFLGFSIVPFFVPTWEELKRNPVSVGYALPTGAVLMVGFMVLFVVAMFGLVSSGEVFLVRI
ncbi:MAG: hypothetical protein OEZ43_06960 [Gammaproteobacteria bacterium]|nr:hypothetical protein [Gammaproteobacteria bacterium]